MKWIKILGVLVCSLLIGATAAYAEQTPEWSLREREDISDVWNGVSVGFAFLARPDAVYIGFYSYDQTMTVGKRPFDSDRWEFKKLPTKIGWDSHNSIAMAFDADDCLHVAGNMHACPLVYFRASKPNDVSSLERVEHMTGDSEARCTYPTFTYNKEKRLIFTYRFGVSGNGVQIWNAYDEKTRSWSRMLDKPLFDGRNLMNAYFVGPTLGPDGYFHVAWVWRDTPDAATNHDLSYARSIDLVRWEKSNGEPCELPITIESGEIVDPVPAKGGILNSHVRMSFDQKGRVVLTYTKYDANGRLQIWNARLEENGWNLVQATDWDFEWNFSGGGSLPNEFELGGVRPSSADTLVVPWKQVRANKSGSTYLSLDTLKPCPAPKQTGRIERPEYSPEDAALINAIESDDSRLLKRARALDVNGERWIFRWEAPDANRDRAQPDGAPQPTKIRVLKFVHNDE